jgi:hypothetical protein
MVGGVIGTVLTTMVFTMFYYLLFVPVSLVLRLAGKDQIRPHGGLSSWENVDERVNEPRQIEKLY